MAEPEASLEVERKYTAPPGFAPPPVPSVGEWRPPQRFDLRAEYYDTPDLELARHGVTLRRRTGGEDAGWHLKSPAAGGRVEEWLGLDEGRGGVPDAFRARLGELVVGLPLVPIAVIANVRHQADLVDADGQVRAHLCMDAVTAEAGGATRSWAEVECELAPDEPLATLEAVEEALFGVGCVPAAHSSKAMRAFQLYVPPAPATLAGSGGDVVLAYAAKQVGALQTRADGVRRDASDAVHKSRVAARRLRSVLRRFAPLLDEEPTGRLVAELRWFGEIAGAPRDAEVLKEHLLTALGDVDPEALAGPAGARLMAELDAAHAAAHDHLVAAMNADRYAALNRGLADLLVRWPVNEAGDLPARLVLRDRIEAAVQRVRRRYRRARVEPESLPGWHDVRKAAKEARYACEALVAPCGEGADATARRWEAVTQTLGDAQDTAVADDTLSRLEGAAGRRGEPTAVYRVLRERQAGKRAAALASARVALDEALADPLDWLP